MQTFHERLRATRIEKGFTQEQLAKAVGVTKSTMAKYDRGELEPNVKNIKKIAQVLGVSVDYLLGIDDAEQAKSTKLLLDLYRDIAKEYGLISEEEYENMSNDKMLATLEIRAKKGDYLNVGLVRAMISALVKSHALSPESEEKLAAALDDGTFD